MRGCAQAVWLETLGLRLLGAVLPATNSAKVRATGLAVLVQCWDHPQLEVWRVCVGTCAVAGKIDAGAALAQVAATAIQVVSQLGEEPMLPELRASLTTVEGSSEADQGTAGQDGHRLYLLDLIHARLRDRNYRLKAPLQGLLSWAMKVFAP